MLEYGYGDRFWWKRTTTDGLGRIEADIELINLYDLLDVKSGMISEKEMRRCEVKAVLNTQSKYLCINENLQRILQLESYGRKKIEMDDGQIIEGDFVGLLTIKFKNRTTNCESAIVLPGNSEPILGLLPLEGMDVIIDPNTYQLVVNPKHPDYAVHRI